MPEANPTPNELIELIDASVPRVALLTRDELAHLARMKPQSLAVMASRGQGPRAIKIGRAVRYARSDVVSWLAGLGTSTQ